MISHNLDKVIARLETAHSQIPSAVESSVNPRLYLDQLKAIAQEKLSDSVAGWQALTREQSDLVSLILATFAHYVIESGFRVSLGGAVVGGGDRMPTPQEIRDWITSGAKDLDQALDFDAAGNPDYERIIFRVLRSIQEDKEHWFGTDQPGHGALNPTGLAQTLGIASVDAERISGALETILAAWVVYIRETLPLNAQRAIHACFPKGDA